MHRIEQIFALSIDVHAEFFAFGTKMVLQFSYRQPRARGVGDDHHRKLSLHDCLIDIDDTATRFSQNLRHAATIPG